MKSFYSARSYPVGTSVGYLVSQLRDSMRRRIDARMSDHGLTFAQWAPLLHIATGRGRTAAELAQVLSIDSGAMTRMLLRLEAKGLIRRRRSIQDRRLVQLELTPEGERSAANVPAVLAEVNNAHLKGFTPEEFETLQRLLRRMIDNGRDCE